MLNPIVYITLIFIFVVLAICCIILFYNVNEKIKLAKIELYNSIDFDSKENLLDKIVSDSFEYYKINNPELMSDTSYINQDKIIEIIKTVTARSFMKMTPAIKVNIALVYNINKDEQLINIIGEKVSLLVMSFASEVNSVIEE